ncbi:hypothetical protein EIN_379310 [Entamoeba invadens IP1]|uniref:Uncharacterized protein n=1 Tax=Entamoeba invadens IP1 TaxID=370355 RepID=A0A0A1UFZ2_ENTIV|nr:hypothetical protein EIN_379310 [Entamoeba invadens IP1]ELP92064.1 hypothetical protein EIN_379310 [Entamoeba invadens IP1]|eukprot:XP_004258835.1 hypothetical protein EIN_379310 [Entamoeba invadens IP1]
MFGSDAHFVIHRPSSTEVDEKNISLLGNIFGNKDTMLHHPEPTSPGIPIGKREDSTMDLSFDDDDVKPIDVKAQSPMIVLNKSKGVVMEGGVAYKGDKEEIRKFKKSIPWNQPEKVDFVKQFKDNQSEEDYTFSLEEKEESKACKTEKCTTNTNLQKEEIVGCEIDADLKEVIDSEKQLYLQASVIYKKMSEDITKGDITLTDEEKDVLKRAYILLKTDDGDVNSEEMKEIIKETEGENEAEPVESEHTSDDDWGEKKDPSDVKKTSRVTSIQTSLD